MPVQFSPIKLLPENQFRNLVSRSTSVKQVLRYFGLGPNGGNRDTVKKRIESLGIDCSHFSSKKSKILVIPLEDVLVKDSGYSRSNLKRRLLKLGVLKNKCSVCGLGSDWNNKPITMRLDHVNGVRDDNRIENLRMVCPNCDSQLETFSGRNLKYTKKKIIRLCKGCGKEICKYGRYGLCAKCYSNQNTKINWPSLDELISMTEQNSMVAIGKMLGVSDNAVRKRIQKMRGSVLASVAVPTTGTSGKSVELLN